MHQRCGVPIQGPYKFFGFSPILLCVEEEEVIKRAKIISVYIAFRKHKIKSTYGSINLRKWEGRDILFERDDGNE